MTNTMLLLDLTCMCPDVDRIEYDDHSVNFRHCFSDDSNTLSGLILSTWPS